MIDADTDAVKAMAAFLKYDDATEPFDKDQELRINKENRQVWQKEFERARKYAAIRWRVHEIAEWTAGLGMVFGFLLLIIFAVCNTYR